MKEDDENIQERKENKWRSPKMADEQLYIIPTIKKRKISYFGHMIRRNNIHRLILEDPLERKISRGRPRTGWLTNVTEWTVNKYENLLRLAQDREPWRIMTAHLLEEDGTCSWWWTYETGKWLEMRILKWLGSEKSLTSNWNLGSTSHMQVIVINPLTERRSLRFTNGCFSRHSSPLGIVLTWVRALYLYLYVLHYFDQRHVM